MDSELNESELRAAAIIARRRKLGPYGKQGQGRTYREKDLALIERAGFNYSIASRIFNMKTISHLEEEVVIKFVKNNLPAK